MDQTAYLSNRGEYTTFSVGDRTITFLTSKNLEKKTTRDGPNDIKVGKQKIIVYYSG